MGGECDDCGGGDRGIQDSGCAYEARDANENARQAEDAGYAWCTQGAHFPERRDGKPAMVSLHGGSILTIVALAMAPGCSFDGPTDQLTIRNPVS